MPDDQRQSDSPAPSTVEPSQVDYQPRFEKQLEAILSAMHVPPTDSRPRSWWDAVQRRFRRRFWREDALETFIRLAGKLRDVGATALYEQAYFGLLLYDHDRAAAASIASNIEFHATRNAPIGLVFSGASYFLAAYIVFGSWSRVLKLQRSSNQQVILSLLAYQVLSVLWLVWVCGARNFRKPGERVRYIINSPGDCFQSSGVSSVVSYMLFWCHRSSMSNLADLRLGPVDRGTMISIYTICLGVS
jgi:hypothetical protein